MSVQQLYITVDGYKPNTFVKTTPQNTILYNRWNLEYLFKVTQGDKEKVH